MKPGKRISQLIIKSLVLGLILVSQMSLAVKDTRWRNWSNELFKTARSENRFVILDLEAVWCHWCHVMAKTTYRDSRVTGLLDKYFIPVRVDQDSRPDLAARYKDYGWPATIIFTPDGREVVKKAGYINPQKMAKLLSDLVSKRKQLFAASHAQKKISYSEKPYLSSSLSSSLYQRHLASFDPVKGSLKLSQKFLDRDSVEYALFRSRFGDMRELKRAHKTLKAALALIDPVWGGVYQYSTHGDWNHPHFEKIMQVQSGYLRIYAMAYRQTRKQEYLRAALDIHKYLVRFLRSPEGAFYTSQDADLVQGKHSEKYFKLGDKARLKRGIPRIDKNRYARENGWVAEALLHLYQATGKGKYLQQAKTALKWVISNRSVSGGGFRHGKDNQHRVYLGDNLAMGNAFVKMYEVTGSRSWLIRAKAVATFIGAHFKNKTAGFISVYEQKPAFRWTPEIDENIAVTRFLIRVYRMSGEVHYYQLAKQGMRYLVTPQVALNRLTEGGILLADHEFKLAPQLIFNRSRGKTVGSVSSRPPCNAGKVVTAKLVYKQAGVIRKGGCAKSVKQADSTGMQPFRSL